MAAALLVSVGGPSFNRQLPKQFPGRLPIAASPTRPRARGGLKRVNALPPTQPGGFFFCLCRARRDLLTLAFKPMGLGRGRGTWRGKSGGPPLFKPSLKVQRDDTHNQNSGFAVAPVSMVLNARGALKVPNRRNMPGGTIVSGSRPPLCSLSNVDAS